MAGPKIDKVEKQKRITIVMQWILDDYAAMQIVDQIQKKWNLSERHAKRYLQQAREQWTEQEVLKVDKLKRIKVEQLKKLKRSLKPDYAGTPAGIRTILAIDKQIIQLEITPAKYSPQIPPGAGKPIASEVTHRVIFENYGE